MESARHPDNEQSRINALREYRILDTLPEADFDQITKIASYICDTPVSLITLIDEQRQWFKSHHGLDVTETPRDLAYCAHAILKPDEPMVVPDAFADERFADNPLATGDPHVVFYAGVPLVDPQGHALGTLCVIDHQPRELTEAQLEALKALAGQVVNLLELRRTIRDLEIAKKHLEVTCLHLEEFTQIVSHDLKSPLKNIEVAVEMLVSDRRDQLDKDGMDMLGIIHQSAQEAVYLTDQVMRYSKAMHILQNEKTECSLEVLVKKVTQSLVRAKRVQWDIPKNLPTIYTSEIALKQILANLFNNAIKHNDKEVPVIKLRFTELEGYYEFTVSDNGPGIPQDQVDRIFRMYHTAGHLDRFNQPTTGIGLPIIRRLVEALGGELDVRTTSGEGTTFIFTIKK